jgi:hypothetical protein
VRFTVAILEGDLSVVSVHTLVAAAQTFDNQETNKRHSCLNKKVLVVPTLI